MAWFSPTCMYWEVVNTWGRFMEVHCVIDMSPSHTHQQVQHQGVCVGGHSIKLKITCELKLGKNIPKQYSYWETKCIIL